MKVTDIVQAADVWVAVEAIEELEKRVDVKIKVKLSNKAQSKKA